jgi:hypothetical protein
MEATTGVPAFGYRMGFPTELVALDLELLAPRLVYDLNASESLVPDSDVHMCLESESIASLPTTPSTRLATCALRIERRSLDRDGARGHATRTPRG